MTDDDYIDKIYSLMIADKELMGILGNPKTPKEKNLRIRRELTPLSEATAENVPLISLYITSTTETENIWLSRAFLNADIYAKNRAEMKVIKKCVKRIFESTGQLSESQHDIKSDTKGVSRYRFIYRPIIEA